jgi:hypothetical protein
VAELHLERVQLAAELLAHHLARLEFADFLAEDGFDGGVELEQLVLVALALADVAHHQHDQPLAGVADEGHGREFHRGGTEHRLAHRGRGGGRREAVAAVAADGRESGGDLFRAGVAEAGAGAAVEVFDAAVFAHEEDHLGHGVEQGAPVGAQAVDLRLHGR